MCGEKQVLLELWVLHNRSSRGRAYSLDFLDAIFLDEDVRGVEVRHHARQPRVQAQDELLGGNIAAHIDTSAGRATTATIIQYMVPRTDIDIDGNPRGMMHLRGAGEYEGTQTTLSGFLYVTRQSGLLAHYIHTLDKLSKSSHFRTSPKELG